MKKTFLNIIILLAFISCSHTSVYLPYAQDLSSPTFNYETIYSSTFDQEVGERASRSIANDDQCIDLVDKILKLDDPKYVKKLKEDPFSAADADARTAKASDKYPVNMSTPMRNFRDRFLGLLKNNSTREPIIRSFEASLRMKSELIKNAILKNNGKADYDLVIVGTGVHGVIALQEALAINPALRILLIDEGDTAGATFRYGKEVFSINSSNRASGAGTRPLPGEGNINELPGFPIQVSDLTSVKYPTANDLGSSIVTGLYAALREHPNVDVLFGAQAKGLVDSAGTSPEFPHGVRVASALDESDPMVINSQKVIYTTGLGESRIPPRVSGTILRNPDLAKLEEGKIPKVVNFEDFLRILAMSNDPLNIIKNKKIGIVGTGDSANVLIEFLLGYAAREGYAKSAAQDGRASKIFWIGQDKKDCKGFISDIRSRYQGISTGFRSSSKDLEAIITPFQSKLSDVEKNTTGKIIASLEDGQKVPEADFVILTTGFEQNLRRQFDEISDGKSAKLSLTDTEFFESDFNTLEAATAGSPKVTKVGRKYGDKEIYALGTAAGKLASQAELVGIIQNFVSIFNNAPRVVASVKLLMEDFFPKAKSIKGSKVLLESKDGLKKNFLIKEIQESRTMAEQTIPYLQSVFKEALSFTVSKDSKPIEFTISLNKNGTLNVNTSSDHDLTEFVNLLASSREFFSLSKEVLKVMSEKELTFTTETLVQIPQSTYFKFNPAEGSVRVVASSRPVAENAKIINNKKIELKGLRIVKPRSNSTAAVNDVVQKDFTVAPAKRDEVLLYAGDTVRALSAGEVASIKISNRELSFGLFTDDVQYAFIQKPNEAKAKFILRNSEGTFAVVDIESFDSYLRNARGDVVGVVERFQNGTTRKIFFTRENGP